MKKTEIFAWILVGILAVILVFVSFKKINCIDYISIHDTIPLPPDTTMTEIPDTVPIFHAKIHYDTLWKDNNIDTAAILKMLFEEYMAKWFYSDTIQDSSLMAIINDSIKGSEIISRQFYYRIKKYVVETKPVFIPDNGLYIGAGVGGSKDRFGLSGSLLYKRKDNIFGLNYDIINKNISLSYHKRLSFKRR